MADTIEALRDQLTGSAGGIDEAALRSFEERCRQDGELPTLFRTYRDITDRVTDQDTLRKLRLRLVGLLDRILGAEDSEAVRGTVRRRKGELLVALADTVGGAKELVAAFQELPDEEGLARLGELVGGSAGLDLQATVLAARIQLATEPQRRAEAGRRLGTLRMGQHRLDEAEQLFRQVLEVEDGDPVTLEALETIAGIRQARAEMLDELRSDAETAPDDASRSRALVALAEALIEDQPDSAEVVPALKDAVAADAANDEAAELLIGRLAIAHKWADIRTVGNAWVEATSDRPNALKVCGRALLGGGTAAPDDEKLKKYRRSAVKLLKEAHEAQKADPEVVDGLIDGLTALEKWDDLAAVLQAARRATRVRSDERRWLVREAEIVWRHRGDMDAAEKMFRRVRASNPRDRAALAFYEDHLTKKEDWKRLHAVLSQKFTLVDSAEKVDVAIQMAELAEQQMGNLDKAIEAYKRVLGEDPSNERAAQHLVELYRKTKKWHALIEFLNSQLRRLGESDAERRVGLLFQIIDVYQDPEKLPVEEMVIHTYNRIVQLSPTNVVALDNLAQRYEDGRRWSELVQVLQRKIEATIDEDTLLDLFHQVAGLYLSKMSSESQAVPFLERILELDPTNLDVVRNLRGIYKAKHNLESLYRTYLAELNLLEGKSRESVLMELAVLATDKLHWHEDAMRHWEELLALSPKNEKAVSSLYSLYAQASRWEDYVALLEGRLVRARTKRKKIEILEKLGQIRFEKLDQIDEAKTVYRQILELNAHSTSARRALQRMLIASQSWDELKALYEEHQDWSGYIAFLDETRAGEDDETLRAEIMLEAVRVMEDNVGDGLGALGRLEEMLREEPESTLVAQMLDDRYSDLGRHAQRLAVLQVLAEHSDDAQDIIRSLEFGYELLSTLDRHEEAFDWAQRAVDARIDSAGGLAGEDGQLVGLEALETAADESERWDDLAAWYGDAATRLPDVDQRKQLLRRHADLLRNRLRKNPEAIAVLEELSQLDDEDWDTLRALEELTYLSQDWPGFERVLVRQIDNLAGSRKKADKVALRSSRLKLGELYEDILDDPDRAVECYGAILSDKPGDAEAVEGLDRVYQLEDRWEDLLALLELELKRAKKGAARVALLHRLADLLYRHLDDPDGAVDRLATALEEDPDHAGVVSLLNTLFDDGVSRARVGELLIGVLRRAEQHDRLVAVLTDRLSWVVEPADRVALLADIASIRDAHLGDASGAFVLRAEQVALTPHDAEARAELERLAGLLDRWGDVAALYGYAIGLDGVDAPLGLEEHVAPVEDAADETALTARLAEIYEAQVEDLERATECYNRVLGFDPENMEILGSLERLHARRADWEALLAVYRTKVELLWEVDEKKSVYLDICQLLRDELDRAEEAIDFYRSFLALDEGNLEVIGELEELYAEFERWEDLVGLLRRRLGLAEGLAPRIEILFELAVIFRDRLEDIDQAIQTFVTILSEDGGHDETILALEALLIREDLPGYEQFAVRVCDVIQPWFKERGMWEREVGVLEVRAKLAVEDAAHAVIVRTIGERYEQDGDDAVEAFDRYSTAFRLDPGNEVGEAALQRVATTLGCWGDWADVLEDGARDDDPTVAVPILMKVGSLARGQLGDSKRAIKTYARLLDIEPLHQGALRALDSLYAETGQQEERVSVLETRAETAEDEASRRALRFEAGRIHEELGQLEMAIAGFAYVAEHGDGASEDIAAEALDRLQQLYEATEQWIQLVAILLEKAEIAADREERKTYLVLAAENQETRLDNVDEAIGLYEKVRGMDPTDEVAFENLARLLAGAERWEDLEELYLDARAQATEDDAANQFDFRLGQLYDHRLERRDDAIDRYEAILDRTPDFVPALKSLHAEMDDPTLGLRASEVLVRAYTATDQAEALVEVLTRRLEQWAEAIDLSATHLRLAQLREHRFEDPDGAFDSLCQAALVDWSEPDELRDELVRLAEATDRWDELEAIDRQILGGTLEKLDRIALLMEMARVARFHQGDQEAAESLYQEVLAEEPSHADSLESLREIYEEAGRPRDMVEVLRLQAEFADEQAQRIEILYSVGAILRDQLEAPEEAVDTYEQILAFNLQERRAYREMERVHAAAEDWEDVVLVLGRELDVFDKPADVVETRRKRAIILYDKVEDLDRALDEVGELLERDEQDPIALRVLEGCHEQGHAYERVLRMLIPIYERSSTWEKLITLYRRHAEQGDSQAQIWALEQIRAIQAGKLDDAGGSFETLQEIARLVPGEHQRWERLEEIASGLGRVEELVEFYDELIEAEPDADYIVPLALRSAGLWEGSLRNADAAVRLYRTVLERDPGHEGALTELGRLFQDGESWADLVALKEHAADQLMDAVQRRRVLAEAATLYEEQLGQPEKAVEALTRVLDEDPTNREALARLEGLLRELEQWEAVEDIYRRWLEVAKPPAETTAVRYRLASALVDELSDVDGALEACRLTLEERSDHKLTVELLERLLATAADRVDADESPVLRARVADLLESSYTDATSWEQWARVYRAQLDACEDPEHEMLLHNQLGTLYLDRAGDPRTAFDEYGAGFSLDFGNEELEATLEALASEHTLWGELVQVYEAGLADAPSEDLRVRYLLRVAELYRDSLRRPSDAAARYEQVLESDPGSDVALTALQAYYEDGDAFEELVRVLRLRLDATDDAEQRVALLYRISELALREMGDEEGAIEALREILDLDRSERDAKDKLEQLYGGRQEFSELIQVYRWKLEFAADPDEKIELLSKTAQVQERQMESLEDAVLTYRDILELSPQNLYAITSLERLYPKVDAWDGLLEIYKRKRGLFASPRDRVGVDFQMAGLLFDRLSNAESSLEHLRLVLATEPDHEGAVEYLERLLDVESVRMPTSLALEPIYTRREDHGKLARLLEVQLEDADDVTDRVDLLRRLAKLRDSHLDDAEGAIQALGQAFLLDPQDGEVRDGLRTVADRSEAWQLLADVYEEALASIVDVDVTREINSWLAELSEDHLDDRETAVLRYREVLAYDQFNRQAWEALARLLEELERWDELVDVLRRELTDASGQAARDMKAKLAHVLVEHIDDPEGALRLHKELLWEDPNDNTALEAMGTIAGRFPFLRDAVVEILKPIHQGAERWDEVVRLLLLGIDADSDAADRGPVFKQVAEIYEQNLGDSTHALAYYREALRADPSERGVLRRIERLTEASGEWRALSELYDELVQATENPDVRRGLLLRGAALDRKHLEALDSAEARYNEVLELDSENLEALDALEELYESQGKIRDLIRVCEVKAGLPIEVGQRVTLYHKIAKAAEHRRDWAKAEQSWVALLDLDSSHVEALRALEALYREREDFERLAETLDQRAAVTYDEGELTLARVELGRLRAVHMDDLHGAVDAYEEALELDETNAEALAALDDLYERLNEYDELSRVLETRIELAADDTARLGLLVRLASIEERKRGRVDPAIQRYEEVLAVEPQHELALNELVRIYHKHERWDGLCGVYERKLALVESVSEQIALKIKAAEIYESKLQNLARATELVQDVLALDASHPSALRLQARLLEAQANPDDAIAAYEALLPTLSDAQERITALLSLGKLYLDAWQNTAKALVCFRDAQQLDSENAEAAALLKRVLYERKEWRSLVPVLEREYSRAKDRRQIADIAHEISRLHREHMEDPEEAFKWLRAGYNARRDHRGIVEDLIEHYTERDSWNEAAPLLAWLVSYLEAKRKYGDLAHQAHRLGQLHERIGQPDKALRYYEVANQYDSRNVQNLLSLGRLLFESKRYDKALQRLQGLLLLQHDIEDEGVKALMFLYLARTCIALGDKNKGRRHLKRLLALDPEHAEGNALLSKI